MAIRLYVRLVLAMKLPYLVLRSSCGIFVQGGASESAVDACRQIRASEGNELDVDVAKLRQVWPCSPFEC